MLIIEGIANFGVILSRGGNKLGYQLGKLAIALLEKYRTKEMKVGLNIIVYGLINHHFSPIHETLAPLSDTLKMSLDIGFRLQAVSSTALYFSHSFFCGENLSQIRNDLNDLEKLLPLSPLVFVATKQAVENLTNKDTLNPFIINYGDDIMEQIHCDNRKILLNSISRVPIVPCVMAYLFHEYSIAFEKFHQFKVHLPQHNMMHSLFIYQQYFLYYGLASLALARHCEDKREYIEHAEVSISLLRQYSANAPQNYLNKMYLLQAEYYAIHGDDVNAKEGYSKAISVSKENGFLHEESIACERAGMYYLESDQEEASALLLQSYNCYKAWGAESKCKHLITLHPFLANKLNEINALHIFDELSIRIDGESHSSASSLATSNTQKRVRLLDMKT